MGDPGRYLSSFADAYMKGRALNETERRGDVYETHEAFRIRDYLDNLEEERQAKGTLATILKNRQGQPPAPGAGPAAVPPSPVAPPEAPEGVIPGMSPVAAGGMTAVGAMGQPTARASVTDTLLQGVSPASQAQFLTTKTGQSTWPTIEAAERERRQAEDREKAETFMDKATQAVQDNEPAVWADQMAAFYRRIGQHDKAARMMEYSAKIRTDKQEEEQAPKDFEAIYNAIQTWQSDPSPANFSGVTQAMSSAKSMTARALSLDTMKNAISKKLAQDPDENAMLQHVGLRMVRDKVPEEQAWTEAMQKFPAGMVKLWQRALISPDKVKLPDSFYKVLRIEAPTGFKGNETLGQKAYMLALKEAKEQGFSEDPVKFTRRWNELLNEMLAAQKKAEQPPAKRETEEIDRDIKKERLAWLKRKNEIAANPGKATVQQISLEIDRLNRDIASGNMTRQEEDDAREALNFYRQLRTEKQQELGRGKSDKGQAEVGSMPPASKYKGKTIRNPETGQRYQSDGKKWTLVQ